MKGVKSFYILMAFLLLFLFSFPDIVHAVDIPYEVRIGLEYKYKNTDRINIYNKEILAGYDTKSGYIPEAIIKSDSGFYMVPSYSYYVSYNQSFDSYEEALYFSQELKSDTFSAFPANFYLAKWYVYVGEFNSYQEAEAAANQLSGKTGRVFIVKEPKSSRIALKNHTGTLVVFEGEEGYPQFYGVDHSPYQGLINLGERQYRGKMEFGRYDGKGITAVNVLPFEEYLYGVVPAEMPASWDIEALKAQAIVARNYAINCMGKHSASGYDLCDGEHCQVYKGYTTETERSNRAVDETEGELLYYNNELVSTFYFSSSGGYTENSEDVWVTALPFLRAVEDYYELNTYTWTKSFSREEIEVLLKNNGKDIGKILDIQIGSYSTGGRVMELTIIGSNGSVTLTKESIRSFFKKDGASLDSRKFQLVKGGTTNHSYFSVIGGNSKINSNISLNQIYALGADGNITNLSGNLASIVAEGKNGQEHLSLVHSTSAEGDFVFVGRGRGHGVGMSQWGAKGMAEAGFNYRQILAHYFNGAEIR
ncbi:MAG TPA: SpoIID/LytB domain-containing protein [Defluviitaleaceae bacterium]|nr:SpoIID/LytB domain-containing protein [Defluviitaleaceae bacterium]HPT76445.1 SpoIID/LytB domain-containing protein [Defluviitaleaceae bacterium]